MLALVFLPVHTARGLASSQVFFRAAREEDTVACGEATAYPNRRSCRSECDKTTGDDAQDARDNTGIIQDIIQDSGMNIQDPVNGYEARGAQNLNPNRTPPDRQPFLTRTTAA